MWHSGSKCQRIGALMKANRMWLKAVLASEVGKLSPFFLALKSGKFPFFDDFFPDLADFWDLDNFSLFDCPDLDKFSDLDDFPDFLACFTPFLSTPNPSTSPSPSFFPEAGLLSSFLLEADLLPSFLLGAGLSGDLVIFSIEMSGAAILLKPWMNRQ